CAVVWRFTRRGEEKKGRGGRGGGLRVSSDPQILLLFSSSCANPSACCARWTAGPRGHESRGASGEVLVTLPSRMVKRGRGVPRASSSASPESWMWTRRQPCFVRP